MAAVVVTPEFDLAAFRQHLAARLPDYARPLFLRIVSAIEITGTFKLRKQDLALEGYDRAKVSDALYFDDRQQRAYTALDESLYQQLQSGTMRL
jgi:fatty-acyl-CoA synthase